MDTSLDIEDQIDQFADYLDYVLEEHVDLIRYNLLTKSLVSDVMVGRYNELQDLVHKYIKRNPDASHFLGDLVSLIQKIKDIHSIMNE